MKGQPEKTIKFALQGGGSHGAFTCGVLDQLLQDERLRIEAVSGTSAGAMNAVALADGMARGGQPRRTNASKNCGRLLVQPLTIARSVDPSSTHSWEIGASTPRRPTF